MKTARFSAVLFLLAATTIGRGDNREEGITATLKNKDFWTTIGGQTKHPELTDQDKTDLQGLAEKSKDPVVRIRANKVLCDLDGHTNYSKTLMAAQISEAVAGAFLHLEGNLKNKTVASFRPDLGFSHVTVSSRNDDADAVWVLIEFTNAGKGNCGLNLRWNTKDKKVDKIQQWGVVVRP